MQVTRTKGKMMFLTINTANHKDQWILYSLKNTAGECVAVNITKYAEIGMLTGLKLLDDATLYLTIIDQDADRMKLANRAMASLPTMGLATFQWTVRDIVAAWGREGSRKNGFPVQCIETGQTWASLSACSRECGLTYSQLVRHINGDVGHKSVKGKTYKRFC